MNYKGNDIDIKPGDVILYHDAFKPFHDPITILSALIRMVIRCHYNHCVTVISIWGKLFIMEARGKGVICRPASEHLSRYATTICVLRNNTPIIEQDFSERAISQMGKPYAFGVLFFVQLWFRITGKWIGKTGKNAESSFVCTSFCAWCHSVKNWWDWSEKEFIDSPDFKTIYVE